MFETITANFDYSSIRRVTENGREYLVADAVILKPGILHGSRGPLFYPEDEVAKNPGAWNGHPITNGHPRIGSNFVSVADPKLPPNVRIGFLRNDHFKEGKRRVKAWFDVQATNASDPRIIPLIEAKKPVGLSTGLRTDNYPVQNQMYKGKPYTHIAKNYKPDHLAILVDQPGACSVKDGCGINVNSAGSQSQAFFQNLYSLLSSVPTPSSEPVLEMVEPEVESEELAVNDTSYQELVSKIAQAFREAHPSEYDTRTGRMLKYCYVQEIYPGYLVYSEEKRTDERNGYELYKESYKVASDGSITFSGSPEKVKRVTSYQTLNGEMVEIEETENANPGQARDPLSGRFDHPRRVALKQAMLGGSQNLSEPDTRGTWLTDDDTATPQDEEANDGHSPDAVFSSESDPALSSNQDEGAMPLFKLTDPQRTTIRNDLAANVNTRVGQTWKGLALNELSDDALVAFHRQLKNGGGETGVVNQDGSRMSYDERSRDYTFIPAPQQTQNGQSNNCGCQGQGQDNKGATQVVPSTPAVNQIIMPGAVQPQKPGSMAEALAAFGTPEEKMAWNAVMETANQQKQALLNQILGNMQDQSQKAAAFELYKDMSITQLTTVLSTMPKPKQEQPSMALNFLGAAGFPLFAPPSPEVKPLRSPVYNFRPTLGNANTNGHS